MFEPVIPVLAVIGSKASGKTAAVETIVRALAERDLAIMTVKHVSDKGFTLDREGTDSWRHWKAGAKIVSTVSDSERAILIKDNENVNLDEYNSWADRVDVIIFEGFSSMMLKEGNIGKIICLKEWFEKEAYLARLKGTVVALCSLCLRGDGVLKFGIDDQVIADRVVQYLSALRREWFRQDNL